MLTNGSVWWPSDWLSRQKACCQAQGTELIPTTQRGHEGTKSWKLSSYLPAHTHAHNCMCMLTYIHKQNKWISEKYSKKNGRLCTWGQKSMRSCVCSAEISCEPITSLKRVNYALNETLKAGRFSLSYRVNSSELESESHHFSTITATVSSKAVHDGKMCRWKTMKRSGVCASDQGFLHTF